MNILFIHQNFPGQFKALAPALVNHGNNVVAFTLRPDSPSTWNGVTIQSYSIQRGSTSEIHPWISDIETKVIRGEACFRAALNLKKRGFYPDVIIAHHGWGESLFLKEVWPNAKLGIYCEFYYHPTGYDVGFDPEFPAPSADNPCRLRLKNINNLIHFESADAGISPTTFQANTFPEPFRSKITVIHDGIDIQRLTPNREVTLTLNTSLRLSCEDELITFVNRNLEPYRGYHIFMRSLPDLLRSRPNARVLIVGGDGVSYGAKPPAGQSWKNIFIDEVRGQIPTEDWSRVHFLGNISYTNFIHLLQISTVHVYLTYPFVLSWSLIEALTMGCCVVASNTAPLQEVITDNVTGKLVDFFDHEELSTSIIQLLSNESLRGKLGSAAREFATKKYSLYESCLPKQIEWVNDLYNL